MNCDLSSGIRADVDVLDALRRDQERAHLSRRRAGRPGRTHAHQSSVEVVTKNNVWVQEVLFDWGRAFEEASGTLNHGCEGVGDML